jgi:hypothetical protein
MLHHYHDQCRGERSGRQGDQRQRQRRPYLYFRLAERSGARGRIDEPATLGKQHAGRRQHGRCAAAPVALPHLRQTPAAVVLQGGGVRVGGTPEAAAQAQPTLPAALSTTPAANAPTAAVGSQAPTAPAAQAPLTPAIAPPTLAATHAAPPTAAAGTPTHRAAVAATKAPTKAAVPTAKQVQAPAPAEERGWFGCQVGAAPGAAPMIDLGLLVLVGALIRRRAGSHTLRSRGAHGDKE